MASPPPPPRLNGLVKFVSSDAVPKLVTILLNVKTFMSTLRVWASRTVQILVEWFFGPMCSPTFAADLSAPKKFSAIEQKLECVDALTR